jgi:Zinc finger, C2H2 type
VLKESKLRPRKKGKALTKRNPPKERLPLPEIHCNKCSGVFHKKDQYSKHYLLQHKLYLCNDCDQSFELHDDLSSHSFETHDAVIPPERYHHPPGTLPICTFCCKEFKSISGLCHHVDSLHLKIPGNFLCNQCGKPFYGKKKLELHMMRHTGTNWVLKILVLGYSECK